LREASSNHYRSDGDEPISGVVCWLLSGQGLVRPNGPWSAKLITRSEKSPTIGWKNANLRSEMTRLLRRAGLSGWPRLFHCVKFQEGRASRQTELQREFPLHGVCSWLGNSPRIAQQSYLLVTEDDFAQGGRGEEGDGIDIKYGEQSDRLAPRSATSAVNAVKTRNQTTEHIAEPPVVHS
jgi:hypothetical protein